MGKQEVRGNVTCIQGDREIDLGPGVLTYEEKIITSNGVPKIFGRPTDSFLSDVAMACIAAGVDDTMHLAGYIMRLRQEVAELRS